ncbi:hypothetical protein TrST_g1438 [Triparma strigata]|uniref:DUF268 domain-containing protein n=1 Tax=Triparma strigata TaxID=1606541 RepID=A0A9W7BTF9_9STRA|nr:hypothetical protein TrST_g1438 [Triparma strigata]
MSKLVLSVLISLFLQLSGGQQQELGPVDVALNHYSYASTPSNLHLHISPFGVENTTEWWLSAPHDQFRQIHSTKIQIYAASDSPEPESMELCLYNFGFNGAPPTKLICSSVSSSSADHTVILGPESGSKHYLTSLSTSSSTSTAVFTISPGPPLPSPCTSFLTSSTFEITDASPLPYIPPSLCSRYSLSGTSLISQWYMDDASDSSQTSYLKRSVSYINNLIEKVKRKEWFYYGRTDGWMYEALEYRSIRGKKVLIIGSNVPWYESMCAVYGGVCTTLEYNELDYEGGLFETVTVEEWGGREEGGEWDFVWSISSFEHDGLGRYGDPLNPEGDLKAMKECWGYLKEGGKMFLSVPVGKDEVRWNEGRVYGRIRFGMMTKGWRVEGMWGIEDGGKEWEERNTRPFQPVFLLEKVEGDWWGGEGEGGEL